MQSVSATQDRRCSDPQKDKTMQPRTGLFPAVTTMLKQDQTPDPRTQPAGLEPA